MKQRLTAEQINGLPEYAREWIHDLATQTDPAGNLAELRLLQEAFEAQELLIAELRGLPPCRVLQPAGFHVMVAEELCTAWSNGQHIVKADGTCRCGKAFLLAEKVVA